MKNNEDLFSDFCSICLKKPSSTSNLIFKVNTVEKCGHKFCSKCIDREAKRIFSCPTCGTIVQKDKVKIGIAINFF
jgi:hypothetical protein